MLKTPRSALAVSVFAAATLGASTAGASSNAFSGHVCSLVTTSAARSAGIHATCVEQTLSTSRVAAASWGNADGTHYLSVHVGPSLALVHPLAISLQPRGPRWLGPIQIAPGIDAYYTLSAYRGTADRAGAMRFGAKGSFITISLVNASTDVLPGLTAVAKSVERRL